MGISQRWLSETILRYQTEQKGESNQDKGVNNILTCYKSLLWVGEMCRLSHKVLPLKTDGMRNIAILFDSFKSNLGRIDTNCDMDFGNGYKLHMTRRIQPGFFLLWVVGGSDVQMSGKFLTTPDATPGRITRICPCSSLLH